MNVLLHTGSLNNNLEVNHSQKPTQKLCSIWTTSQMIMIYFTSSSFNEHLFDIGSVLYNMNNIHIQYSTTYALERRLILRNFPEVQFQFLSTFCIFATEDVNNLNSVFRCTIFHKYTCYKWCTTKTRLGLSPGSLFQIQVIYCFIQVI